VDLAYLDLSGASQVITATGAFRAGEVRTFSGAAVTVAAGSAMTVTHDFQTQGSFRSEGRLAFAGVGEQRITGMGSLSLNDVRLVQGAQVTAWMPFTVTGQLRLDADLTMVDHPVTMATGATSAGTGDVWGTVRRPGPFDRRRAVSFGNPNVSALFTSGTPPAWVQVKLERGAPLGLPRAVARTYEITSGGGQGWQATLRLRYRSDELNGEPESTLYLYRRQGDGSWQLGVSRVHNTAENWVEQRGVEGFSTWGIAYARVWSASLPVLLR
jgi:hypothetical protein